MEDMLFKAANEYLNLMNIEYFFQFGKKHKLYNIRLIFPKECFHHIAGLKKSYNTYLSRSPRSTLFDSIIEKRIDDHMLQDDKDNSELLERLYLSCRLKRILESNNTNFLFCADRLPTYSRIEADYLFVSEIDSKKVFLFISHDKSNNYFCRSLFFKHDIDFTVNQIRLTLLYRGKRNILSPELENLYGNMIAQ